MPLPPIDLFTERGSVPYVEHGDQYGEQFASESVRVTRRLRCLWGDRFDFVLALLGYTDSDPNGDLWRRHVPERHRNPGVSVGGDLASSIPHAFIATSCTLVERLGIQGQDQQGFVAFYARDAAGAGPEVRALLDGGTGFAVYDVDFKTVMFAVKEDTDIDTELERYVVRRPKYAIENLTVPSQSFQWGPALDPGEPPDVGVPADLAGKAIAGDITKPFPTMALTYEWLQIPKLPNQTILQHQGKVNDADFDPDFGDYPAETLLFNSMEVRPIVHGTGHVYWDLIYQFLYRPTGWNKIYKPGAAYGDLYKVVNRNAGKPSIYDTFDFMTLFKASSF